MKLGALVFVLLGAFQAEAYHLKQVYYNANKRQILATVVYEGGLQKHEFSTQVDPCQTDTNPRGLSVLILDTGFNDTGTDLLETTVAIDLNPYASCLPAEVTVFVPPVKSNHLTVWAY